MIITKPHIGTRLGLGDADPIQPLDYTNPLLEGVQGFWLPLPHLVGGSRLYDLSPYGRHGGITGAFWISHADVLLSGLDFDGIDDVVDTTIIDTPSSGVTAFAWHIIDTTNTDFKPIICKYNTSTDEREWWIGTESNEWKAFTSDNGTGSSGSSGHTGVTPTTGTLQSIAITHDGSTVRVILNGDQIHSYSQAALHNGTQEVQLGGYNGGNSDAKIFMGSVWGRYMSVSEIAKLDDQARRGFPDLLRRRTLATMVEVSGGTTIAASLSEGATAGDNLDSTASLVASLAEGALAGDQQVVRHVIQATLSEGSVAGDTMSTTAILAASLSEGIAAGESPSLLATLTSAIAEGADAGETWATTLVAQAALSEGLVAGDQHAAAAILTAALAEGSDAGDAFASALLKIAALTEGAHAGDQQTATAVLRGAVTEGVAVGDGFSATAALSAAITEGAQAGDDLSLAEAITFLTATITVAARLAGTPSVQARLGADPDAGPQLDGSITINE